jgi:hypothetical protein
LEAGLWAQIKPVNSRKTYTWMRLFSWRHIWNLIWGSSFKNATFIEFISIREERVELRCSQKRHTTQPCGSTSSCFYRSILIYNNEILLAAVYKSPGRAWINEKDKEFSSFRNKWILAGNMNAKHPFWNNALSNHSTRNYFIHYSQSGTGDVLDMVIHNRIILPNILDSAIFVSDNILIILQILVHVRRKKFLELRKNWTDWKRFQSLTSNFISSRNEINSGVEADKAACDFTASVASTYRLSTTRVTLSDLNNDLPGIDRLLNYK